MSRKFSFQAYKNQDVTQVFFSKREMIYERQNKNQNKHQDVTQVFFPNVSKKKQKQSKMSRNFSFQT